MAHRNITARQQILCSICATRVNVVFYDNKRYRGGHYFGKIPLHSKRELQKMYKSGTRKSKISNTLTVDVYNYEPRPHTHIEYWECPDCYWHPKSKVN